MTKSGHAQFLTRPFHRLSDLPDQIYGKLMGDRRKEFRENTKILQKLNKEDFAMRELFICDSEEPHRDHLMRSQMRGMCKIKHYNTLEDAAKGTCTNNFIDFYSD